jgi:hypothetical protein
MYKNYFGLNIISMLNYGHSLKETRKKYFFQYASLISTKCWYYTCMTWY